MLCRSWLQFRAPAGMERIHLLMHDMHLVAPLPQVQVVRVATCTLVCGRVDLKGNCHFSSTRERL